MARRAVRQILADRSGAAAILIALSLPVIIGGFGMGAEVGLWMFNQRKLQNAADVAAYAAATELRAGRPAETILAAAVGAAERTGYREARGEMQVRTPPTTGAFTGNPNSVEVVLEEDLPRLFSGLFAEGAVPTLGRAVAQISGGNQTCVLALDETAHGGVTFIGNANSILVGCNVHANSLEEDSIIIAGSSNVEAGCLSASGMVSQTGGTLSLSDCVAPYEHADIVPDPYAGVPVPNTSAACTASPNNNPQSNITIAPGRYCGGLDLKGTINLQPGLYIVQGSFKINASAKVFGDGVTFYFPGTVGVTLNGSATVDLTAPASGDYKGMMFYFDRTAPVNTHKINGTFGAGLDGAIYAKTANIEILGDSGTTVGCTQVVANTIKFSGNSSVSMDCSASNVQDILSARLITLVE
jgi:hypothetical protein